MKVEYWATEMMIPEFCTKLLQGIMFRLFQKMIMNINDKDVQNIICAKKLTLKEDCKSDYHDKNDRPSQACVEKKVQIGIGTDES